MLMRDVADSLAEKNFLFLHHSPEPNVKAIKKQLQSCGCPPNNIDEYDLTVGKVKELFLRLLKNNISVIPDEHTYDYLIIEGNLGFPAENNITLSDPAIEQAAEKNKEITILINHNRKTCYRTFNKTCSK